MSVHTGVSCDACMKANFAGRRYKCLLCDNYDLCGTCFDVEAESQNHTNSHPMQCILTKTAYELFYAGESIPYRTIVSLTCPYCGVSGFIPRTLLTHCVEKHPSIPTNNKNSQIVMCPICVIAPSQSHRSRVASLADHIATVHDDEQAGEDDGESVPPVIHARHGEDEEGDSDQDEDDDDEEEPPLNDPEHRAFIEEEHRRQEAARQRLAHASTLAAATRESYAAALNGNAAAAAAQRRPLTRQTAIRGSRGSIRGRFNDFPYGAALRSTGGLGSGASLRCPPDATTAAQNAAQTDPYSAAVFAQDPMLEFVSRLVNSQQQSSATSTANAPNGQFLFTPSIPVHIPPPNATAAELARLQQQIENNDRMIQIKSTLLQSKQRRSSQAQQQQQQQQQQVSAAAQQMTLTHPSGLDYQLWQQQFPPFHNLNFLTGAVPVDSSSTLAYSSKSNQQSQREIDTRSLLGKILRSDRGACENESSDVRLCKQTDHLSFIQSMLLSSIGASSNASESQEEIVSNENPHIQSDVGKENTL